MLLGQGLYYYSSMDIVSIISSVSKIAILAFTITLGVVIFEVVTLIKKNRNKQVVQDHVDIPDFNQDPNAEQHFTQLPNAQAAPAITEPRNVPKPVLLGVGIVTIVLLTAAGMWIFTKNRVRSTKTAKEVSPVANTKLAPTKSPKSIRITSTPFPTAKTQPTAMLSPTSILTPTSALMPTIAGTKGAILTITPTGSILTPTPTHTSLSPTPAVTGTAQQKGGVILTPTVAITSQASATATLKPTVTLPRAGTFQTSLVLVVVSITLIYLALIL